MFIRPCVCEHFWREILVGWVPHGGESAQEGGDATPFGLAVTALPLGGGFANVLVRLISAQRLLCRLWLDGVGYLLSLAIRVLSATEEVCPAAFAGAAVADGGSGWPADLAPDLCCSDVSVERHTPVISPCDGSRSATQIVPEVLEVLPPRGLVPVVVVVQLVH